MLFCSTASASAEAWSECSETGLGLRYALRGLPGPQQQVLAKGLWQMQETLRCTSSLEVLGCVDEDEAEGSRTNGSAILRKETVGSRFKGQSGFHTMFDPGISRLYKMSRQRVGYDDSLHKRPFGVN